MHPEYDSIHVLQYVVGHAGSLLSLQYSCGVTFVPYIMRPCVIRSYVLFCTECTVKYFNTPFDSARCLILAVQINGLDSSMVYARMMLCGVICQVVFSLFPIDIKLPLFSPILQPIESHVDCL